MFGTARTVFDRTIRAACGFESLHVRDSAFDSFAVRPRVHLYARFARCRKAEKVPNRELFHMFQLDEHSPREALLAERSIMTERTSCPIHHIAEGPPGRAYGLSRPSPVLPA